MSDPIIQAELAELERLEKVARLMPPWSARSTDVYRHALQSAAPRLFAALRQAWADNARLQSIITGLTDRVAAQSELLARTAREKQRR